MQNGEETRWKVQNGEMRFKNARKKFNSYYTFRLFWHEVIDSLGLIKLKNLLFVQYVFFALEIHNHVEDIYTDFAKAFDGKPHSIYDVWFLPM